MFIVYLDSNVKEQLKVLSTHLFLIRDGHQPSTEMEKRLFMLNEQINSESKNDVRSIYILTVYSFWPSVVL